MTGALRVGLAGLGTVGVGVLRLLKENGAAIAARAGRPIEVVAVSARDRTKDRGVDLGGLLWHDDPSAIGADVDVVVELIGGAEGVARDIVQTALSAGLPVVTANKALIALHGHGLARLSAETGAPLMYEAAVAGGIPAIRIVRGGLAADRLISIGGILNGTCNYILTEMRASGRDFTDVLAEAQANGFAEADPSTDVDGWDTAHKLAILAGIAFAPVNFASVRVNGIGEITASDLQFADALGYRIKLIGMARAQAGGGIEAWTRPCMIPATAKMASVDGVFNAVATLGDYSGPITVTGRGAGEGPTASAVVSDLISLARGATLPVWGMADPPSPADCVPTDGLSSAFYLRAEVEDRLGVMADLTAILRDHDVSVHLVSQHDAPDGRALVALVTHPSPERAVAAAARAFATLPAVRGVPLMLKIEDSFQ